MQQHILGLAHVAVHTADLEESVAFYQRIGGTVSKRDHLSTPMGEKRFALVDLPGVTLELIESPTPVPLGEGNLPHLAFYVDDLDAAASQLRAAGVDTFLTPEKRTVPHLFGGLENWFFTGPSGEQIELMKML